MSKHILILHAPAGRAWCLEDRSLWKILVHDIMKTRWKGGNGLFKNGNVTVMVSDLQSAVQYYVETLGLRLQYEVPGHWAQVEAPGLTIGLHPVGENGPRPGKSESLSIGFEVQELVAVMDILQSRGVEFSPVMEDKATRIAYFRDPDGNPLYLVEVKEGTGSPPPDRSAT
jgi:catechol 2,3-dioxygenase-like lactoylglutathione lyase family enzyme